MGFQYSERARVPLAASFVIGFVTTAIFLIIAISLHNLYAANFVNDGSNASTYAYHVDVGAFEICVKMDGTFIDGEGRASLVTSDYCSRIHADCSIVSSYTANGVERSDTTDIPNLNCAKFNAFRSFFVLSVIASCMVAIASSLYVYANARWGTNVRSYFAFALFFVILDLVCLMISWSIVANVIATIDSRGLATHGAAFGLAVSSWVIQILSSCAFVFYHLGDPMRKHIPSGDYPAQSREGVEMTT